MGAHVFNWELTNGPVPSGLELDHLCRVPRCVNPDHLEPVTCAENQQRGNAAKLTKDMVIKIAKMRADGITQDELAREFGISQSVVSKVLRGDTWKNVDRDIFPKYKPKLTEDAKKRVVELSRSGMNQRDIAEIFGVTQPAISWFLLRRNKQLDT